MPPDPDLERAALLARIIAAGDRRRRRRLAVATGTAVAVVLAVTLPMALRSGDRERVAATADDSTSTSTTEPATTTGPPEASAPIASTTTEASTTSTTEPPLVCRNSYDPRCGDFYWDYDPSTFPNRPVAVSFGPDEPPVVAGAGERFTVTLDDPDSPVEGFNCAVVTFRSGHGVTGPDPYSVTVTADGIARLPCAMVRCECDDRYGPWDPPPPPSQTGSPVPTYWFDVAFDEPGSHTVTIDVVGDEADCDAFDGYQSTAHEQFSVEVLPA